MRSENLDAWVRAAREDLGQHFEPTAQLGAVRHRRDRDAHGVRNVATHREGFGAGDQDAPLRPTFNSLVIGAFALLGLILAAAGVYGVTAHAVGTRRPFDRPPGGIAARY